MSNNLSRFSRSERLLGKTAMEKLANSRVAVFGVGGVGGYCVEALARSGIGNIALIDADEVALSNLNRQIIALSSTIGKDKVEVAKNRILDINPDCKVQTYKIYYNKDTQNDFDLSSYDYIVDAIDSVESKVLLIVNAKKSGTQIISCMGAGNKKFAYNFKVADIYSTKICPLAKIMRKKLKEQGVTSLKVVYSEEEAIKAIPDEEQGGKRVVGSLAFVPSVAGLIMAGEVVLDLIK